MLQSDTSPCSLCFKSFCNHDFSILDESFAKQQQRQEQTDLGAPSRIRTKDLSVLAFQYLAATVIITTRLKY